MYMDENITQPGVGPVRVTIIFDGFEPNTEPAWAAAIWADFDISDYTNPQPCQLPPDGKLPAAIEQQGYIFHPRGEFNISQQDHGDATGDTFFVCQDLLTNQSKAMGEDYQILSSWTVSLVPRWGQYQNCNFYGAKNQCYGNEHFWVGHEAALGMGDVNGGQCVVNPLVGEWFSLPEGGKCADGAAPGDGSCTWAAKRIKTIDSQCLFGHGFLAACKIDGRAPFVAAQKVFLNAFASIDPAQGGCPALPGP